MNQNIPRGGNTLSGQSFRQGLLAAGAGTGMFVTPPTPRPTQAQIDAYNNYPDPIQMPNVSDTGQYRRDRIGVVNPSGIEQTPAPAPIPEPALSQPTGRRDAAPMSIPKPMLSDQQIGMGEALMRIGGAGLGGAREGGLASMSAMSDEYGAIQDYNRSAQQKAEEATSLAKYRQGLVDAKMAKIQADQQKGMAGNVISDPLAYTAPTITAIDSVLSAIDQEGTAWWPFNDVTGVTGTIMSAIPGSKAHDVKMDIQTIQAAVGFDRLQAMRDASPTGGALGQVSEMELKQLNASLGALAQSQSAGQFRQRLEAVKRHYVGAVNAIRAQQQAYAAGMSGAASAGPDADKFAEADAIVNNS